MDWDTAIILAYLAVIIGMGTFRTRLPKAEGYLLMGRQLTLPGFVLSLVASWYGGILGSSEYGYLYGLSNWIVFGLPYYVFAIFFALFLARRARERYIFSIPDLLAKEFGEKARGPASWLVLILASPAPYILSLGLLLNLLFGIPVVGGILLSSAFSYAYVFREGLSAIIRTDLLQSGLMFIGYLLLVGFAMGAYGGIPSLIETVANKDPLRLTLTGGQPLSVLAVWFFIGSWTLVAPMFHQRVYALRNELHARPGILLSVVLWGVFDCLTTLSALYAFGFLEGVDDPRLSHFVLAETVLPAGLYGIFITGILAVIMSTLDTELFVSGSTLGPDILGRTRWFSHFSATAQTRIGMGIVLLASIAFALTVPSVVDIYFTIGTIAIPGLLIPVLSACGLVVRRSPQRIRLHLILVPLTSLLWWLAGRGFPQSPMAILQPFYPGMAMGLAIWFIPRNLQPFR